MNRSFISQPDTTPTPRPRGTVLHGFLPEEALEHGGQTVDVCYIPESRPLLAMARHNIALAKKFDKRPILVTDLTLGYLVRQNCVAVFKTAYYSRTDSAVQLPAGGWLLWVLAVQHAVPLHAYASVRGPERWSPDDAKTLAGVRLAPHRTAVWGDAVDSVPVEEASWMFIEPSALRNEGS